jgi:rod shape determining protein RodA
MGNWRSNFTFDWVTLFVVVAIASFGLFLLLTIREQYFLQQGAFVVVGVILSFLVSRIDGVALRYLAPYFYIASVLLLALTYVSPEIRGASRWIMIGTAQLQPSELVKPFLLLSFAGFIADRSPRSIKNVPFHIFLFLIPFFLIFKQPDLGTSIVYASFWFMMLFAGGVSLTFLFGVAIVGATITPVVWHFLAPFQKLRIITFFNPSFDPKGAGYNAFQAMIAVGSGQLFGRGLGRGTQSHLRFLPEFHTDFIFATLIEELGLVGGAMLFMLYGVLLWRIIRPFINMERTDNMYYFFSVGLFGMLLTQILVNTGMNMGIIPITGITLPLVSYGGSSILSICVSFGFLWSLRRTSQELVAITA